MVALCRLTGADSITTGDIGASRQFYRTRLLDGDQKGSRGSSEETDRNYRNKINDWEEVDGECGEVVAEGEKGSERRPAGSATR